MYNIFYIFFFLRGFVQSGNRRTPYPLINSAHQYQVGLSNLVNHMMTLWLSHSIPGWINQSSESHDDFVVKPFDTRLD